MRWPGLASRFGNPVAANNFMLEDSQGDLPTWVWIDLESGVPALFSINPLVTLKYYLPKSWVHRRWLFDDIDTERLKKYIYSHGNGIKKQCGDKRFDLLLDEVNTLATEQRKWRAIGRVSRSIQYALSQEKITQQQADYFQQHALFWQFIIIKNAIVKGFTRLAAVPAKIFTWVKSWDVLRNLKRSFNYVKSSRYRWGVARWFVARRLKSWSERGYLNNDDAFKLRKMLHHDDSSAYLTDFSVHIALKPVADIITWGILPIIWLNGTLPEVWLAVLIIMTGPLLRVSYTSARIIQEIAQRQKPQWIALLVGMFPVIGNLAYPTQLLYRSAENSGELARFIIYDISAAIGRKIPVWGGADTSTEHLFNRMADKLVRSLNRVLEKKARMKQVQKSGQ